MSANALPMARQIDISPFILAPLSAKDSITVDGITSFFTSADVPIPNFQIKNTVIAQSAAPLPCSHDKAIY